MNCAPLAEACCERFLGAFTMHRTAAPPHGRGGRAAALLLVASLPWVDGFGSLQ